MKKGILLAPAAMLLHQGVTYAVPVGNQGHPVESAHGHSQGYQQPDILKYMKNPHQNVMITEGLHSQKGAITAVAKNKAAEKTHILHTGGDKQVESKDDVHDYLTKANVDLNKITHSKVQAHRPNLSHEKNRIGEPRPDVPLHDWESEGHVLLHHDGEKTNIHVMGNVPAETVIDTVHKAHEQGGLGFLHHHASGAGFRNNAQKELEDRLAIGEAVHKAKGTMIWTHRDDSWDPKKGNPMTQPAGKLREFQPHDHVASAEESSTYPHNKAEAIDKIGKEMLGDAHIPALRREKLTGKETQYKDAFDEMRKSETKDGEAGKSLDHLEHVWHEPAMKMLKDAHAKALGDKGFAARVAKPETIAKHLAHISNKPEYIGDLRKAGMQLEMHDSHLQGALVEAAHNKNGDPTKGPYFVPVSHHIAPDQRVMMKHLNHVDPSQPVHWQMVNGDVNTAFHNAKAMHQGQHQQVFDELAEKYGHSKEGAGSTSG